MTRKRMTQIFPFLLPLRQKQRKLFFYLGMRLDKNTYAERKQARPLSCQVCKTEALMINEGSGFPLKYQYNKVHNLKLAAKKIDGLLIRPGETFSFWKAAKDADRDTPYLDGLSLVNGKIQAEYGGGLCQLSNLLYYLFLHTPLTITERHGHGTEAIPPAEETLSGMDATVAEGWLDLKAKNETAHTFQIEIRFTEEKILGRILSDSPKQFDFHLYNAQVRYTRENGKIYEYSRLCRKRISCSTGEEKDEILCDNRCIIAYPLPAGTEIEEGG